MIKPNHLINISNTITVIANNFFAPNNFEINNEYAKSIMYIVYLMEKVSIDDFNSLYNTNLSEESRKTLISKLKETTIYKKANEKVPYFKYLISGDKSSLNKDQTIKLNILINYLKSFIVKMRNDIEEKNQNLNKKENIGIGVASSLGVIGGILALMTSLLVLPAAPGGIAAFVASTSGIATGVGVHFSKKSDESKIKSFEKKINELEKILSSLKEYSIDNETESFSYENLKRKIIMTLDLFENCMDKNFDIDSVNELRVALGAKIIHKTDFEEEEEEYESAPASGGGGWNDYLPAPAFGGFGY